MIDLIPEEFKYDLDKAISLLKEENCTEVYIFGSLATKNSTADSDIDLAVRGLKKDKYFHVYGKLLKTMNHSFDLVGLDYKNDFSEELINHGTLIRVF